MSRRYDLDNPNRAAREWADETFESYTLASGGYRIAPVDVWGDTFHGMEEDGWSTEIAAAVARAASRAARAALLRALRAPVEASR